ncbi:DUF1439 domain-containing protein [Massilia cavernae]|uniref:DUF1439 domain-containing protein n=1 Tax=Massilia cavernae TaxID=2320864 RepID=A0A418XGV8_9BURK|nr:DUF1439 domain-containing protein [Massilia cavernae]RJG11703.1 DUF1439 domain-containing protein [Massilia cavernae]
MKRTSFLRAAAAVGAGALLASCAGILGPRQVELPLHKLQASIDRRFPLNNRMLELFEIQLTRPQLALIPDTSRIALTMDAAVAPPFLRKSWTGTIAMSGGLRLDAARGAVYMVEPRVDRVAIGGMDDLRQRQMAKVANLLVDQTLRDMPMYSLKPEDLRYAGVQFVPRGIAVTRDALVVTLEPAR